MGRLDCDFPLGEPATMTTMRMEARRSASRRVSWRSAVIAAAIVAMTIATSVLSVTDAENPPAPMLSRAHEQLERLMSSRSIGSAEAKEALLAMRTSLRPVASRLHRAHPELSSALESELDDALAQTDGDGALMSADRAEFEVYYLVPIAQTLADVDDALRGNAR